MALFTIRRRKHRTRVLSDSQWLYIVGDLRCNSRRPKVASAATPTPRRARQANQAPRHHGARMRARGRPVSGPGGGARAASRGGGKKGHERERPTSRGARHGRMRGSAGRPAAFLERKNNKEMEKTGVYKFLMPANSRRRAPTVKRRRAPGAEELHREVFTIGYAEWPWPPWVRRRPCPSPP